MPAILRLGSTGPDVTKLQKALNQARKPAQPKLLEDGSFGQKTLARVVEFQKSRGLPADGVAGPATQGALGMAGGSAAPGGGLAGGVAGSSVGGSGDLVGDVVSAVQYAVQMWKLQAHFQGIRIIAPAAIGGPGCLVGPSLAGNIANAPHTASKTGDDRAIVDAAAAGIAAKFAAWQSTVTVPGLPWYPGFVAMPLPYAPPTPNVPTPLMAGGAGGTANLSAGAILSAMSAHLRSPDARKQQTLGAIAIHVSPLLLGFLGRQMVVNVMGHGPVPTFAPPAVMVGPVVNGTIIAAGQHLR